MKKVILLICIGLALLSCSSDDDAGDTILVLYNQTYCSDSWGTAETDTDLADIIKNHFQSVNIEIYDVSIDNNGTPESCLACSCLSGKRIILEIKKEDINFIKEHGFQVKK